MCRGAIHLSLLAVYGYGGWLVSKGLLPLRVLLSAIGYTFSLVFATQGMMQSLADTRRLTSGFQRWADPPQGKGHPHLASCVVVLQEGHCMRTDAVGKPEGLPRLQCS